MAQKEGFYFPSYSTTKTGPAHMPTFVSTVQVGGEIYQGREYKTKKQAEMNAAKVAYNVLLERKDPLSDNWWIITDFSIFRSFVECVKVECLTNQNIKN